MKYTLEVIRIENCKYKLDDLDDLEWT